MQLLVQPILCINNDLFFLSSHFCHCCIKGVVGSLPSSLSSESTSVEGGLDWGVHDGRVVLVRVDLAWVAHVPQVQL